MIKFLLGFIIGVFFLPTTKEIIFINGIRNNMLKEPISFIRKILNRTFKI
jgi:hypothetical protein